MRSLLLQEIEHFLGESRMTASAFGREAVGDNKFVTRIQRGAGITLSTVERAESFIAAYRSQAGRREPQGPQQQT
ncbi:MAG: hypothetical protein NVSMB18_12120 [Acetobacteraceae bacterium]